MTAPFDYKRFAILYVDDELNSLKYFSKAFKEKFWIFTAANAQEGYRVFNDNRDKIGILMCDQRMPGDKGVQFLEKVALSEPRIQRILVTAYSDLNAAIDAVNKGAIYHYVTKPWDIRELEITLKKGLEFVIIQQEKGRILSEKVSSLHNRLNQDKIVSLSNFLAGLNHHIRNALVPIKMFLDMTPEKLKAENVDVKKLKNSKYWVDLYSTAQNYVEKINYMIQHLDKVLQPASLNLNDQIDIKDLLENTVSGMMDRFDAYSIQVKTYIEGPLPLISADSEKLIEMFTLLFNDEIVTLPSGSNIELHISKSEHEEKGEAIRIVLIDDGPGFPEDSLKSIFDPLFVRTEDSQELGINLVSVFMIVHNHGGRIEVEKNQPTGIVFKILLPLDPISAISQHTEEKLLEDLAVKNTY